MRFEPTGVNALFYLVETMNLWWYSVEAIFVDDTKRQNITKNDLFRRTYKSTCKKVHLIARQYLSNKSAYRKNFGLKSHLKSSSLNLGPTLIFYDRYFNKKSVLKINIKFQNFRYFPK